MKVEQFIRRYHYLEKLINDYDPNFISIALLRVLDPELLGYEYLTIVIYQLLQNDHAFKTPVTKISVTVIDRLVQSITMQIEDYTSRTAALQRALGEIPAHEIDEDELFRYLRQVHSFGSAYVDQ